MEQPKGRQRLKLDLESLFPGDELTVGETTVTIRPLVSHQIATITRKLKTYGEELKEQEVTWDNFKEPENIFKIATTLIERFPDVLAEASNIHVDDIQNLPIDVIVQILDKVLEVNLKSKESLEKNFSSLTAKLNQGQTKKQTSPKRSKS